MKLIIYARDKSCSAIELGYFFASSKILSVEDCGSIRDTCPQGQSD
jgi:hypothetical protein